MHAVLLQVTLDALRIYLLVRRHVFEHRAGRRMLETDVKNGRHEVLVQVFWPRETLRPATIIFGFLAFIANRAMRATGVVVVVDVITSIIASVTTASSTDLASRSTASSFTPATATSAARR